jgi:hypothetical protein
MQVVCIFANILLKDDLVVNATEQPSRDATSNNIRCPIPADIYPGEN